MRRGDHETSMALTVRLFLLRLAFAAFLISACAVVLRAGGPKCVAGWSYFDSTTSGQPLVWPQGVITYYTDQGDLSPILPNASANSFVSSAFGQWTSVSTTALSATSGGQLGEDVNGTNVYVNANGTISMPADIQSTATGTPVGVVYDADGSVTDALLGAGAGDASQCFFNAVFGGNDNYGSLAVYQHALIVINGQCAQQSSQLTDVEYRLVRVIGEVLGLGWSQLNLNVQTGSPRPTSDDYAGFPVMHFQDSWILRTHHRLLSESLPVVDGRCRCHLSPVSGHIAKSIQLSRQASFLSRHRSHSRLRLVHRHARQCHAAHAGCQCCRALD